MRMKTLLAGVMVACVALILAAFPASAGMAFPAECRGEAVVVSKTTMAATGTSGLVIGSGDYLVVDRSSSMEGAPWASLRRALGNGRPGGMVFFDHFTDTANGMLVGDAMEKFPPRGATYTASAVEVAIASLQANPGLSRLVLVTDGVPGPGPGHEVTDVQRQLLKDWVKAQPGREIVFVDWTRGGNLPNPFGEGVDFPVRRFTLDEVVAAAVGVKIRFLVTPLVFERVLGMPNGTREDHDRQFFDASHDQCLVDAELSPGEAAKLREKGRDDVLYYELVPEGFSILQKYEGHKPRALPQKDFVVKLRTLTVVETTDLHHESCQGRQWLAERGDPDFRNRGWSVCERVTITSMGALPNKGEAVPVTLNTGKVVALPFGCTAYVSLGHDSEYRLSESCKTWRIGGEFLIRRDTSGERGGAVEFYLPSPEFTNSFWTAYPFQK